MNIGIPDFLSMAQNFHIAKYSTNATLYEKKTSVYLSLAKYLSQPFKKRTAYEQLLNIAPRQTSLDTDGLKELELHIKKLFSDEVYSRYTELLPIFEEFEIADSDLNELFETVRNGEPEIYEQIKDSLLDDQNTEKSEQLLDSLTISFVEQMPWHNRTVYSYREIEKDYELKKEQYVEGAKALLEDMEKEIERF